MDTQRWTPEEMMTVAAARCFRDRAVCFVGVGTPSLAACLAQELHAQDAVLVYESGAIGARPTTAPLSIADSELAETAQMIVGVPEIFGYWLQGGRIDMGFLSTAQIDPFGRLNTTVIGDYRHPRVRLPGAGGAPAIASGARQIVVIAPHSPRTFVQRLDFVTTVPRPGVLAAVVTDQGILHPDAQTGELVLVARHPGIEVDQIRRATGWPLVVADRLEETQAPREAELLALRALERRTRDRRRSTPALLRSA